MVLFQQRYVIHSQDGFFKPIEIDIKPGSDKNPINLKSKGKVPVAILTTNNFSAGDTDPDTVNFAGASPSRCVMEDIDNDIDEDLLCHFKTQELNDLNETSSEANLVGNTHNGESIKGMDVIKIVP